MADSFYVSGLSGKSGARSGGVFTPGGTGSMTSGDDYSRSGTEFYPVVTPNDGDDGSAIDNLNTRGTEAPAGSAIQPSINDSVAVELMLEDKEVIIDTRGRVELPDIDDLDFINSSVKPNPYAYATSYYTTFYVRNYSYNWNDNSYLSVDINGKVTDIYANSYGTVRMDYYPTDITPAESIGSLTFNVDVENTNKYKTLKPGNYIVWKNNTAVPVANQPYCVDGLLYIPGENDQHHNLTYATVSKNARIIVDSDVSNADISAVQKWWSSAYFTYVANIWQKFNVNTGNYLVSNTNGTYNYITGASILLDNIPDTLNKFFLICGNFGVGDEIVRYSTTFIITPNLLSNNSSESAGSIEFENETSITSPIISSTTIEFEEGKLVTIIITPNAHYKLNEQKTSFKRNGSTFSPNPNDEESIDLNNDGTYTVIFRVNSAATYEVIFDKQTYTINVSGTTSNNVQIGNVIGDNTSVEYGKTITLNAIANYGYHFEQWLYNWSNEEQINRNNPLTIEVNDAIITNNSVNIIVSFVQNPPDTHNVNVELYHNHGQSRAYAAPTYVPTGSSCLLQAYPGEEDDFDKWQMKTENNTWNDLPNPATDNPYQLNNITEDTTVRAVFKFKTYTVTININTVPDSVGVGGSVINVNDPDNNELQNGNSISVEYDSNITLRAITNANDGFVFNGWSGSVANLGNELQINNIKENKTVTANFVKTYKITVVAEPSEGGTECGTVSGGGTYIYGFNTEISAAPISSEYRFDHWSDNGAQTHNIDVIGNATYTAYFVPNPGDDETPDPTDEEEEWPGDEYYDNEEENEAELTLNNISADIFINYIKPRVAIVSGNQLERIHGEFLPIFCLPNNYNSMTTSELSEMYNNSTYMICYTSVSSENDGNTVFCNIVKSTSNISINLCDNYEEYCTYKYNDGKNRYVILDDDINSLHSYTYNYVTTAFQATGDPNTICHTAAYINIYDNVVTQEFRNDGKYSVIDAMSRKNSTYMMYVSFNIDPYYDAKVLGGKNMTYTSVSLFRCSNYNGLSDNSNVTLFHSENMPNVADLTNGIFNEDSKRGAFVFMIDNETNHNIDTTYNPSTFDNNTDIILHSDLFFNPSIVENANDKTFIESIILANPMCTISYTNTDKIKTAYFVNGDEYTTELLWHTPISEVSVELYPSYIVNHGNISNITYKFTDKYSNNDSDIYIIPNVNTNINKNNDIYTIAFSDANILNNLDINFDNTIEEKKYKVCNTVLVGENQNVIECTYNTVTLIADVPSKTPITASVIVKQEIPKFKLNNDWPQEPTP